jgi:hypothetical protein
VSAKFAIEPLGKGHHRKAFSCGNERIDHYFCEAVTQDIKRRYATCFVARDLETGRIAGFYTLSSSNVPLTAVPGPLASRLPRYPTVPAVLIGWLGRDQSYAGFGLGEALLFDATKTIAEAPIGAHAIEESMFKITNDDLAKKTESQLAALFQEVVKGIAAASPDRPAAQSLLAVNRRANGTPYRRAKGTPFSRWRKVDRTRALALRAA